MICNVKTGFAQGGETFDKFRVEELKVLYFNNSKKFYQNSSYDSYSILYDIFTDKIMPEHYNLLDPSNTNSSLGSYFRTIDNQLLGRNVSIDFIESYTYPCTYFDPVNAQYYAIVTCTTKLIIDGTVQYNELLIQIDLSDYKIFSVFSKNSVTDLLPQCSRVSNEKSTVDSKPKDFDNNIQSQIVKDLKKGNEYYMQGRYFEAIKWFEAVLKLEPKNQVAIDRINDCNHFLDSQKLQNRIVKEILSHNYSYARDLLNKMKTGNYTYDPAWYQEQLDLVINESKEQRYQELIDSGNYYFKNKMYEKASEQFLKAADLIGDDSRIKDKLDKAKLGTSDNVENELKLAYNRAVASKKNWVSTFITYLKYENSGHLKGEHYVFMCLVMYENKKVPRKMGYSKEFARSLAKEYFFKAKKLKCKSCSYDTLNKIEFNLFNKDLYN